MQQVDPGLGAIGQFGIAVADELLPARGEVDLIGEQVPIIIAIVGSLHGEHEALPCWLRLRCFRVSILSRGRLRCRLWVRIHAQFPPFFLLVGYTSGGEGPGATYCFY